MAKQKPELPPSPILKHWVECKLNRAKLPLLSCLRNHEKDYQSKDRAWGVRGPSYQLVVRSVSGYDCSTCPIGKIRRALAYADRYEEIETLGPPPLPQQSSYPT